MCQVSSSTVFFFVTYIHTCPRYNVLLEVVCCCFPRNELFINMTLFVESQSYISIPSFMFFSAAVIEIRKLNQNKKEKNNTILKLAISNLTPFLGI